MDYKIYEADKTDHACLIEVWEQAVRATHHFLSDKEIVRLKQAILENYFDAVLIQCCKNQNNDIIGFIGTLDNKIEMLFISPKTQGQGIGSALCQDVIANNNAVKVDVNEQNPRAKAFYEKMGFQVVRRSKLDEQGKPYPILHMEIVK